jgi:hypothetical protein
MTRKQENIIILGIFTLLLVIVLGFNMFSTPENIRPAGSAPAITIPVPAPVSQEAAKSPGTQPPDLSSRQKAGAGGWGRDPFTSSWLNESSPNVPAMAVMNEDGLTVTLILISATKKIAVINHRICQEGDMVGDEKIVSIKRDAVVLEKNGARRVLPLPKSVVNF